MKKVIFVIQSEFYCNELLNHYVERNSNYRVFNFFSAEEMLLYMGLEPSIIVYGNSDPAFTPRQLRSISDSLPMAPQFLAANGKSLHKFNLSDSTHLAYQKSHDYYDIYQTILNNCLSTVEKIVTN